MNKTTRICYFLFASIFSLQAVCASRDKVAGIPAFEWMDGIGSKQVPPSEKIYNVSEFGAVSDTAILSTKAIQSAIDLCSSKGGGMVTFSPGTYCTGTIYLKSGVNLNIPEGVELYGSQDINQYPLIRTRVAGIEMDWPSALITALNQENIAISGNGKVWGQGKVFWDKYWSMRKTYDRKNLRWIVDYDCQRPRMILFQNCRNVTMTGNDYLEAGFWTVHILYSSNVTIDGIKIDNNNAGKGPSTDGIDIDSSDSILIQNCDINCNDDNFCLKSGRDADGLRVNRPTEYVVIRNCVARQGGGLFTCGSETSGGIRNVVAYNMKAYGTKVGLRFKSALNRGGVIEDIWISNIYMSGVHDPFHVTLNWNPNYSYSKLPEPYVWDSIPEHWKVMLTPVDSVRGMPKFRNIHFTDIVADSCQNGIVCEGEKESPAENFTLKNVAIKAENAGHIYWAKNWKMKNVSVKGEDGQKLEIKNSINVKL